MAKELAKAYEPSLAQQHWFKVWEERGYFNADPEPGKEQHTIMIPLPNVTGALHMGHALNGTVQDLITRWKRMQGFSALWMPGTDHAGIATQAVVERRMLEEEGLTRHDIGRDALVERIWKWKDQYEGRILDQLKSLGASCDWRRVRFTLDEVCSQAVRRTFFKLFDDGLIFRGKRLVNWDTHLQTAVADDEVFHEDVDGSFWTMSYPLTDGSGEIVFSTTRPETMLGDTAVCVHPTDERYTDMIGKTVTIPVNGREIPIIADGLLADKEKGTGAVKVTPAHDPNDYGCALRNDLPMINILNPDGKINEEGGDYEGLTMREARKKIIEKMEELGHYKGVEDRRIPMGMSDRSKTPIEPYLSDQWFVKMDELAQSAIDAADDNRVRFFPSRYKSTYVNWLAEKRDWCISRQLWWGHRIPIWPGEKVLLICVDEGHDDVEKQLEADGFEQDPDVLDTWFSSALWPHATLGWPDKTKNPPTADGTGVLITSRDIITLWVARMVLTGLYNMGDIPFGHVYIHPKILDGFGQTMSKSKGNGVDPLDLIEKYGTDAVRFTIGSLADPGEDVAKMVSERFEYGRNFCNKLWNASRFACMNLEGYTPGPVSDDELHMEDRWILSRLSTTVEEVNTLLSRYQLDQATRAVRDFTWNEFCDWYLEMVKPRLRDESLKPAAQRVLVAVLDSLIRLLHPWTPFITEELWALLADVAEEAAMVAAWPTPPTEWQDKQLESRFERLQETIVAVRNIRGLYKISPKVPLKLYMQCEAEVAGDMEAIAGQFDNLAKAVLEAAGAEVDRPKGAASFSLDDAAGFIPLEGIIDIEEEVARKNKEADKIRGIISGQEKKLANEKFVSSAPPEVVQDVRDKLETLKKTLENIIEIVHELGGEVS
ncbi:UNVERIFIED_CONTAM: hypothetical protein GTU68_045040 [Idotea baltica]|nr:hypothetical protein [Idotea baltica]